MEVQGTIKKILESQVVSDSFTKREIWIEENSSQYPQVLNIQFVQDSCDLLNDYNEGDMVKININLRGRLWTSPQGEERCFNTINGWRIEKYGADIPQEPQEPPPVMTDDDPDLPF
jgi:single-strand DNA-binding protein